MEREGKEKDLTGKEEGGIKGILTES